jgi:CHAT domain-containing protein
VYYLSDSAANEEEVKKATQRSGFGYLPGTSDEVKAIARAGQAKGFDAHVFEHSRATELSIRSLNGAQSPAILHIATHGFFFDDPAITKENKTADLEGKAFRFSENPLFRSGLLFAGANETWTGRQELPAGEDGILTSYEVSTLYLPHTRLVVLSACETALGDIRGSEGVYGLQRAFKMAGVDYLVMSLWKVPDQETAEFMQYFYDEVFNGRPIARAFYSAQRTMREKYSREPFKWAAWILLR